MAEQFNEQQVNYTTLLETPIALFVTRYSFDQNIGDLKGKSIIDYGCGEGIYCRKVKQLGASEVVGVDLSEKMIAACNKNEQLNSLGIKYMLRDIRDLPKIEEFDIGLVSLILHLSETREQLLAMCTNIYKNLKFGGRIFGVTSNPNFKGITDYSDYYYRYVRSPTMQDGDIMTMNAFHNSTILNVKSYYFSKETYEKTLTSVGFKNVKWTNLSISPEGIKKFGPEFWKAFLEDPHMTILTAEK